MKQIIFLFIIAMALVAISGCISAPPAETETLQTAATPAPTAEAPVQAQTAEPITMPIIVVTPKLYGVDFSFLDPIITDNQNLEIPLHFKYRINYFNTDTGIDLYLTYFAYNLDKVPEGFSPKTTDDVKSSGIPYKTRRDTIYYLNEKTVSVSLPEESSQGTLDLSRPYNYGAVVEWTET